MAINLLASGLTSLREVTEKAESLGSQRLSLKIARTKRLNVHMNRIKDLDGLQDFKQLEDAFNGLSQRLCRS